MGRLEEIEARIAAATPFPWTGREDIYLKGENCANWKADSNLAVNAPEDVVFCVRVIRAAIKMRNQVLGGITTDDARAVRITPEIDKASRKVADLIDAFDAALEGTNA